MDEGYFSNRLTEKLADSSAMPFPHYTSRNIVGRTNLPGKVTAVVGMRRVVKTTYLHQVREQYFASGIPRERLPYINFEDESLIGLEAAHLGLFVEAYYRRYPQFRRSETVIWSFDEIQVVPGWERFVRRLLDSERVEILVSGSSATMLSREIATSLRGRAWEVVIHPFSFAESLRHRGESIPDPPEFVDAAARSRLERDLVEYLKVGGFPETQSLHPATRHQLLSDYIDVAILRDVVERHKVTNVVGLRWMVRQLLGNAGAMFSVEKFYRTLKSQGFSISKDTVHELLSYLTDCFLIRTIWMEASSERQRMVNPRKAYPIDPGLIPIYDRSGRANTGHALETVVCIELERRHAEATYVRTADGYEVDFFVRYPGGSTEIVQVCADLSDPQTTEREIRALLSAGEMFNGATMRLITLTRDPVPRGIVDSIIVQPAYEWLLTTNDTEQN